MNHDTKERIGIIAFVTVYATVLLGIAKGFSRMERRDKENNKGREI